MDQMSLNDENPLCWNLALTFRDTGSCIDPSALGIAINAVALFTGARFPSRINLSLSLSLCCICQSFSSRRCTEILYYGFAYFTFKDPHY